MKSILYVAAALMIGASIYGFVDYSKTNRHKEFKSMYDENEITQPVKTKEGKQPFVIQPETISKKEIIETKSEQPVKQAVKKKKKKRMIDVESFSRAPLRERERVVILDSTDIKVKDQ